MSQIVFIMTGSIKPRWHSEVYFALAKNKNKQKKTTKKGGHRSSQVYDKSLSISACHIITGYDSLILSGIYFAFPSNVIVVVPAEESQRVFFLRWFWASGVISGRAWRGWTIGTILKSFESWGSFSTRQWNHCYCKPHRSCVSWPSSHALWWRDEKEGGMRRREGGRSRGEQRVWGVEKQSRMS